MMERLLSIFHILLEHFGQRHWWPGDTPLEISIGAILTQNCAWRNVEKAIDSLKSKGLLEIGALHAVDISDLAQTIRSSGFYNVKSKRLKAFINVVVDEFNGSFEILKRYETEQLRTRLLAITGIGPETADSILLYALEKPVFVIDAYTRRFLANHGLRDIHRHTSYQELQQFFMDHLPKETYLYNEFHALIVRLCQSYCRKIPRCRQCPLGGHELLCSHPVVPTGI